MSSIEKIWFQDPKNLFTKENWNLFVPTPTMTIPSALNAVVRFTCYFTVLLFVATHDSSYMMLLPAVLFLTFALHTLFPNGKKIEEYMNAKSGKFTEPTENNPFMNVLLTEIGDNPDRPDAAPTNKKEIRAKIAKAFQHTNDIYMDTTDMFDQTQAMRTFHTLQSATVPNDQDGFLAWLSKGSDTPDHSSAPLARGGKLVSGGYVPARGSAATLPNSTNQPTAGAPTSAYRE
jgi:hypothetical protein